MPLIRRSPVSRFSWNTSPAGVAHRVDAGVEVGQEAAVRRSVEPDRGGVTVVDGPADVVVAAQVGAPHRRRGLGREAVHGRAEEPGVLRRQRRPDLHHQRVLVGQVADLAGVLADPEVRGQVCRPDDRLGLEDQRGCRDPRDGAQGLRDRVHLGLVLAGGPHPLEQEGDRVEPQALDAEVGQPQDEVGELEEHVRVVPVEVPLPGVEGRPDPRRRLLVEGEAARRGVREHLGQGPLVRVGQLAVGEQVEVAPVESRPRGARRPPKRARRRRG